MCADYAKYQVQAPVHEGDAPLTQEQRSQLKSPGRVHYDSKSGEVRIDTPVAHQTPAPAVGTVFKKNGQDFVVLSDGDAMPVDAAKNAGLYPSQPDVPPQAPIKSEEKSQDQQDQPTAEDRVGEQPGDASLGQYAERFGDSAIYSLIEQAALGKPLTDAQALTMAQTYGAGVEPGRMREVYSAFVEQYGDVATAALVAAGVPQEKVPDAMAWLATNQKGKLVESFYDLVSQTKRSTSALKNLGRDYVQKTGGGFSDAELEAMELPENASWQKGSRGELLLSVGGNVYNAQAALRSGLLKA